MDARIAPEKLEDVEMNDGILCLGSSAYNAASLAVEAHPDGRARLHYNGTPITVGPPPGGIEEDLDHPGTCFIQRVRTTSGQIRVEVAGLSTKGTDEATTIC